MEVVDRAPSFDAALPLRDGAPAHTDAYVFPGQGSQGPEMRATVRRACPHLLDLAVSYLGCDPFEHQDEGTHYLQPAIYCASVAAWVELAAPEAGCLAGHSLGEISALVAAGSLAVEDGLRLVVVRGGAMHDAACAGQPGGMLAIDAGLEEGEAVAARFGLTVANDNAPRQVVLSGPVDALSRARAAMKRERMATKMLPVRAALHSPAMQPAVGEFERVVAATDFSPPRVPLFSCVTAEPFDDIRQRLVQSITSRVRWREIVQRMRASGIRRFCEVGPGGVLTGLIRRTLEDAGVAEPGEVRRRDA